MPTEKHFFGGEGGYSVADITFMKLVLENCIHVLITNLHLMLKKKAETANEFLAHESLNSLRFIASAFLYGLLQATRVL
jgi:hypothetical protein